MSIGTRVLFHSTDTVTKTMYLNHPGHPALSISIHSHSYINNSYQQEASGKAFFTSPFFSGGPR